MSNSIRAHLAASFLTLLPAGLLFVPMANAQPSSEEIRVFCQAVLKKTPAMTIAYNRTLALSSGRLIPTQSIDYSSIFVTPSAQLSFASGVSDGVTAGPVKADASDAATKFSLSAPTTSFFYGSVWSTVRTATVPIKVRFLLTTPTSQVEPSGGSAKMASEGIYVVSASWNTPGAKGARTPLDIASGPFKVAVYIDNKLAEVMSFDLSHAGYRPLIEAKDRALMSLKGLSYDATTKAVNGARECKM